MHIGTGTMAISPIVLMHQWNAHSSPIISSMQLFIYKTCLIKYILFYDEYFIYIYIYIYIYCCCYS